MNAIDEEVQVLRETFVAVFRPVNPLPFGSDALGTPGLSDGNAGVQWNTWIDRRAGVAYVAVNLEGKEYNGWPIGRLIRRELEMPKLFATIARLQQPNEIEVV